MRDPTLRVFDCTLTRIAQPSGASLWQSGREGWGKSDIPGAGYLHMVDDFCDATAPVPLTLAGAADVASVLSGFGVTADSTIVLYGAGSFSVIHRVWWVLAVSGARDVHILDGGWQCWIEERRPVETGIPEFSPSSFDGVVQDTMLVTGDDVAGMVGDAATCLIHSLSHEQFLGTGGQVYGRAGRIPGSVNVPAQELIDPKTGCFRTVGELTGIFARAGLDGARVIVPYCGGGIAASTVFFALKLLGYENVSLYDNSLLGWARDPAAPMVAGPDSPF